MHLRSWALYRDVISPMCLTAHKGSNKITPDTVTRTYHACTFPISLRICQSCRANATLSVLTWRTSAQSSTGAALEQQANAAGTRLHTQYTFHHLTGTYISLPLLLHLGVATLTTREQVLFLSAVQCTDTRQGRRNNYLEPNSTAYR